MYIRSFKIKKDNVRLKKNEFFFAHEKKNTMKKETQKLKFGDKKQDLTLSSKTYIITDLVILITEKKK